MAGTLSDYYGPVTSFGGSVVLGGQSGGVGVAGGYTPLAQANLAAFAAYSFDRLTESNDARFNFLADTFTGWANWQQQFGDRLATILKEVADKSAKAPSGLLSMIFG